MFMQLVMNLVVSKKDKTQQTKLARMKSIPTISTECRVNMINNMRTTCKSLFDMHNFPLHDHSAYD